MRQILASHPSGNANVRQLALALAEADLLAGMATGLALRQAPPAFLPSAWKRELSRRRWSASVSPRLLADPGADLLRLGLSRLPGLRSSGLPSRFMDWQALHHDRRVARRLRQWSASAPLTGLYGYEDSAANSLKQARARGLRTFLELPTLHSRSVRMIQEQEATLRPQWRALLPAIAEPSWKLRRKQSELLAADWIVVPSQLVRDSCRDAGLPTERILVVPYGSPNPSVPQRPDHQPPVALYVGRLAPAKGLDHLLDAWRHLELPEAELWLVGSCDYPSSWLHQLPPSVRWLGSVPHGELERFHAQAQVFVMPSLLDGWSLATAEAMASGLPPLITDRCGIRDLVEHGRSGWIVPAADSAALATDLRQALQDPARCRAVGAAARERVSRYSWADYRRSIAALIEARL